MKEEVFWGFAPFCSALPTSYAKRLVCFIYNSIVRRFLGVISLQTSRRSHTDAPLQTRSANAATGRKSRNRFVLLPSQCSSVEPCRPFRLCPTMHQVVRKFFFTDCRCASAHDGSKSYEELFAKLDANKDGKVDVSELRAGLASMGIRTGKGAAQVESWKRSTDHKGYRKRF